MAHDDEAETERKLPSAPPVGTVSHGTLRTYDLINAFRAELQKRAPAAYQQTFIPACGFSPIPSDAEGDDSHGFWDSDEAGWLLEALVDALNDAAPEGYYFGAHEGDGADFGFWPHGDDE